MASKLQIGSNTEAKKAAHYSSAAYTAGVSKGIACVVVGATIVASCLLVAT